MARMLNFLNKENLMRYIFALLTLLPFQLTSAQVAFPQLPQPTMAFSYEDKDWQVQPITSPKSPPYHKPTPLSIPGARVIKTLELQALLASNDRVLVVDVLDSQARPTIPGAYRLSGAGDGRFFRAEKSRFSSVLEKLTAGDRNRPIVFLCLSSECWLSYNASLHALEAGYNDVIWYRGGIDAWSGASLELKKPEVLSW